MARPKREGWIRAVEWHLYNRKRWPIAIQKAQEELQAMMPLHSLVAAYGEKMPGGGQDSPVERTVIEKLESPRAIAIYRDMLDKQAKLRAVNDAVASLTPDEQVLVELRYDKEYTNEKVAEEMHVSLNTFFRLKKRTLKKVAVCLGLC